MTCVPSFMEGYNDGLLGGRNTREDLEEDGYQASVLPRTTSLVFSHNIDPFCNHVILVFGCKISNNGGGRFGCGIDNFGFITT